MELSLWIVVAFVKCTYRTYSIGPRVYEEYLFSREAVSPIKVISPWFSLYSLGTYRMEKPLPAVPLRLHVYPLKRTRVYRDVVSCHKYIRPQILQGS
jgi:hypothetical protein